MKIEEAIFPAVTICSLGSYSEKKALKVPQIQNLEKAYMKAVLKLNDKLAPPLPHPHRRHHHHRHRHHSSRSTHSSTHRRRKRAAFARLTKREVEGTELTHNACFYNDADPTVILTEVRKDLSFFKVSDYVRASRSKCSEKCNSTRLCLYRRYSARFCVSVRRSINQSILTKSDVPPNTTGSPSRVR